MKDLKAFVYQPTIDALELKKGKGIDYVLARNQREYLILNLSQFVH